MAGLASDHSLIERLNEPRRAEAVTSL
jgi:hypothetical protein